MSVSDWQVPDLPDLGAFNEVVIDLETTGLRWWDEDRMIGAGLWTPDGRTRYFPIRHKTGPNIDRHQFLNWCRRELRNKRVVNIRTKFDLHMLRADGVNLDEQGCTFGDVAHYAALLDDHRRTFNQEDLARDFLSEEHGKLRTTRGYDLDPSKFADYPAGLVAERACHDVATVARLQAAMWPQLTAQDLHRVREIEDQIIPCVVEMEHNGCPIDVELLERWCGETQAEIEDALWQINRDYGVRLATPNKYDDLVKLFQTLHLDMPGFTATGKVSFADDLLEPIQHPAIQQLRRAQQLTSLNNKFLLKYRRSVARDGILRYELHQLPYQDDAEGGGGAVSGRFSSAALTYFDERGKQQQEGANVQQVFAVRNQKKERPFTANYIVRKLHVPAHGRVWLAADASQIEYRLFAHFANDEKIVNAYRNDRKTDYHDLVQTLIKSTVNRELHREHTKRVNFAQVYGAGVKKMAEQLGITVEAAQELSDIYHRMFPSVKPLLALASHLAMPEHKTGEKPCGYACRALCRRGFPHRGYVMTYLGRRARFGKTDRHYSGLNRVIQGSAADVNKRVMIEVHKLRHKLGLTPRMTVHDEWDGDLADPRLLPRVTEVFNTQYYEFRVPILWEVHTGNNWAEAK